VGEIRYYADEHVSKAVLKGLRQRGIDVLGVFEAGLSGAPDETHLAFAAREGRVLFTQDADLLRLAPRMPTTRVLCTLLSAPPLERSSAAWC